ncbi:MAG: ribosome maturation factor RimM [Oscillospiraceae bacterium]|nr:ribosome maturation factor RimM [Oscillospiraceae bacterium]
MKLDYLELGTIVGVHGLQGELRVKPMCDSPAFFQQFATLYYDAQGQKPVRVVGVREHKLLALLKLEGITTAEQAHALRSKVLYFKRSDAKLDDDQYFIAELVGCAVYDAANGTHYGEICDVTSPGRHDVWHIRMTDGRALLIPVIDDVVKHVDIAAGRVEITMLAGLMDANS